MSNNEVFFESFNMSVEAAYDAYFKIAEKDILKGLSGDEDELFRYVENETGRWGGTPLTELKGVTPVEYLDSVNTLEELVDMFRKGAHICDGDMPGVFLEKLRSFGTTAIETLMGFCRESSLLDGEEASFMIPLMAVQVLGQWEIAEAAEVLTDMLDYKGDVCDLLYEKVRAALINIGEPAVDRIIKAIEARDVNSPQNEHLLMALADAACKSHSDAAYRCLKSSFLKMQNKAIGAYCLGNYGDGRAIPALRGYLDKAGDNVSKEEFFDTISAIQRLGGNTSDLGGWED